MSIYLICVYILLTIFAILSGILIYIFIKNNKKYDNKRNLSLRQKKSSIYVKYNAKNKQFILNKSMYDNEDITDCILKISKEDDFLETIKTLSKSDGEKAHYRVNSGDLIFNVVFSFKNKEGNNIILKCDYDIEKHIENVELMDIKDLKKIHEESKNKNSVLYYLNIKEFNIINQRYGQQCGDYILEVIKKRLLKIDKKKMYCSHLNSDQFIIYYNKRLNKNKTVKVIKRINRKLTKSIDVGYVNIEVVFGIGVCIGNYGTLDEFLKCSYIASDYAKKRKQYNIVIYNDGMKLEENVISISENELRNILDTKEIVINYNAVYNHPKSKFIGYMSNVEFQSKLIDFEKMKSVAIQNGKIDPLMNIVIDGNLVNYLKKRPNKSSKLFINLKLEDLSTFLEVYLSNPAYSECKIVICLDVRKGYEMINKFSNISSNVSKIVEEGVEFALLINYNNMYDYDYILKNSSYLILDNSIIENINNNVIVKNKLINVIELAKNHDLELFATEVKEYIQFESLIKYGVNYFSGPYFGSGSKRPNEIEQSKTRIFAKFMKDSKKNKNN